MKNLSPKDKQKLRMLEIKNQLLGFGVRNYADHIKNIDSGLYLDTVTAVYNLKQVDDKVLEAFETLLKKMKRLFGNND